MPQWLGNRRLMCLSSLSFQFHEISEDICHLTRRISGSDMKCQIIGHIGRTATYVYCKSPPTSSDFSLSVALFCWEAAYATAFEPSGLRRRCPVIAVRGNCMLLNCMGIARCHCFHLFLALNSFKHLQTGKAK